MNKFLDTKFFGILNLTHDSFSDGGLYLKLPNALKCYHGLLAGGADFIDVGAQSTAYGREQITPEKEWAILKTFLLSIADKSLISIDTYNYLTAKKAIDLGVRIINDVSGGRNSKMLELIAQNQDTEYICMFSLIIPANKKIRINSIEEIEVWFTETLRRLEREKINLNRVILDPGIGFATTPSLSFEVIKNIEQFRKYGVRIMVGHSRKSFLEDLTELSPAERDIETLAASIYMLGKIDYLRIHNIEFHQRAKKVWKKLIIE